MSLVYQFLVKTFILKVVEYSPTNFTQFTLMVGGYYKPLKIKSLVCLVNKYL